MGGIIEDKIFEALKDRGLTVKKVREELENLRPCYQSELGTIDKHLRKMYRLKQLDREKINGRYVYWNPAVDEECKKKNGICT